jgi:hypothetical protein
LEGRRWRAGKSPQPSRREKFLPLTLLEHSSAAVYFPPDSERIQGLALAMTAPDGNLAEVWEISLGCEGGKTMKILIGLSVLTLCLAGGTAMAQGSGGGGGGPSGTDYGNHMMGTLSQEQFDKLGEYADQAKRLTKDSNKGKTLADLQAEDKATATELAKALPLACEVTDAVLAAEGPATFDGKQLNTHTYEVACGNGLGYYLIAVDGGKSYGFSCMTADATNKADATAGRKPGTTCGLGSNLSVQNMMTTALMRLGVACTANKVRQIGISSKANLEYNEVACADGAGYVLISPLPGSQALARALTCRDAVQSGLDCQFTDAGVPTLSKLLAVFKSHNVACTADEAGIKYIGRQNKSKRYVIEMKCPEQPKGLVAFVPFGDNLAPFETKDCKGAVKEGVACTLTK